MSWSKSLRRTVLAAALLGLAGTISACSFSPVYSGALAEQSSLQLAYAKPTGRLEQIIYQELALRLGESHSETAPLATVSVSAVAAELLQTATTNPAKPLRVTVTATLNVVARDGSELLPRTFTRTATAQYTRSGQVLADNAAASEASERAARSAAESLRLAVLAAMSR